MFKRVKEMFAGEMRKEPGKSLVEIGAGGLDFILLMAEKLLVLAAIVVFARWGYKLFIVCDVESILKAKEFLRVCHEYWIGALVFTPLLFLPDSYFENYRARTIVECEVSAKHAQTIQLPAGS